MSPIHLVAGALPQIPLGELTALPKPSSWWGGGKNPSQEPYPLGPSGLDPQPFEPSGLAFTHPITFKLSTPT